MPRQVDDVEYTEAQRDVMAYRVNIMLEHPENVAIEYNCNPRERDQKASLKKKNGV